MNDAFAPQREEDVCEMVRWALSAQQPLWIAGLNTKQGFGFPAQGQHGLSLRRLTGILEYEPEELVMRAAPGTALEEVEEALRRHGQHLAFEPPALGGMYGTAGGGSVGGVFAGNLSGPRRFRAGAARDHVLGVRAVSGRGECWRSGGRVIKNVTGYDLSKLMAGSWGTLSVITELTFKVLPAPAASLTLAVAAAPVDAFALMRSLAGSALEPSGLAFLPEQGGGSLLVRLEGSRTACDERARALRPLLPPGPEPARLEAEASQALWRKVRDVEPLQGAEVIVKVSLPATDAHGVVSALPAGCRWYADAAGSWLWLGLEAAHAVDAVSTLRRQINGRGSCVIWRAPPQVRVDAGVLSPMDPVIGALSRRLKQGFDPDGILSPGRLMSA